MAKRGGIAQILGGLTDLLERLESVAEQAADGRIDGSDGPVKGVYGVSVKMGLGGEGVSFEPFGHTARAAARPRPAAKPAAKPAPPVAPVADVREPLIDVFPEAERIVVVAEMPGVEPSQVEVEVEGDVLQLTAASGAFAYAGEVLLPGEVRADGLEVLGANGVIEIRCPR